MLTFKEYILETPELDYGDSRRFTEQMTNRIRDNIEKEHSNSQKIGKSEEGTYHKLITKEDPSRIHYYHSVSNKPREISVVKDNIQYVVSKGENGNSEHNKWLMKHHAKNFGELSSYETHTLGSKKLWSDLAKDGDKDFSIHHNDGNEEHKIDSEYLNKNENNIWNKGREYRKHKLTIKSNV